MHLNHKDQLHLIGSGKKSKKQAAPSTPAATTAASDGKLCLCCGRGRTDGGKFRH